MQRIAWLIELAVVAGVLAGAFYLWARRQPDPGRRAVALRQTGFWVTAGLAFFFGAMLAGETFTDPGGWAAAGLVAAWAVPLAGLVALSWFRPGWAVWVLAVLSAAVIGASIWLALSPQAWRAFEDRHGPIQAVITFVVVAAIAVLGLKRTLAAGTMMVIVGVIPVAVSSLGGLAGAAPLAVVSTMPVITGILYLVSARLARRPPPPASTTRPDRPTAA